MSLARVLLPCVSESFLAVDFFQKYSAKGFFVYAVTTRESRPPSSLPLSASKKIYIF
jgi:hypothetical protein